MRRRVLSLMIVMLLSVGFVLGLTPGVFAAPSASPKGKAVTAHDMSHPERVNLPCPGQPRTGYGLQPISNCSATGGGVSPNADFPNGCYNNVGYRQTVNGKTSWSASAYGVKVTVEYWWCPKYNGDTVGQNWSYGTARPAGTSCVSFITGISRRFTDYYGLSFGAWIADNNSGYWFDDEDPGPWWYNVCPGPTGYVWDYSKPGTGASHWKAYMEALVTDLHGTMPIGTSIVNDGAFQ